MVFFSLLGKGCLLKYKDRRKNIEKLYEKLDQIRNELITKKIGLFGDALVFIGKSDKYMMNILLTLHEEMGIIIIVQSRSTNKEFICQQIDLKLTGTDLFAMTGIAKPSRLPLNRLLFRESFQQNKGG